MQCKARRWITEGSRPRGSGLGDRPRSHRGAQGSLGGPRGPPAIPDQKEQSKKNLTRKKNLFAPFSRYGRRVDVCYFPSLFLCSRSSCVTVSCCTQVHQYTSTPVHRYTGTPVHQYTGTAVHQYTSTPVHQYTSTPVHQNTSTPVHQYTSTPVHWYTSTPVRWYTSTPLHQYASTPVHQYTSTLRCLAPVICYPVSEPVHRLTNSNNSKQ